MEITVKGMNCKHCEARVIEALKRLKLKGIKVNLDTGTVIYKDHKKVNLEMVKEAVKEAGYEVI